MVLMHKREKNRLTGSKSSEEDERPTSETDELDEYNDMI